MARFLLYALGAIAAAGASAVYLNAQGVPAAQGHSMVPPDTSQLAAGDAIVEVKVPVTLSPNAQIGKRAFDLKCASCHGANAAGTNDVAPPLIHSFYEPNHHSDYAFIMAAKTGVRSHHWSFGDMPPVDGVTDGMVRYITQYIREVQKENGIF
jgi:cytochrome c2